MLFESFSFIVAIYIDYSGNGSQSSQLPSINANFKEDEVHEEASLLLGSQRLRNFSLFTQFGVMLMLLVGSALYIFLDVNLKTEFK